MRLLRLACLALSLVPLTAQARHAPKVPPVPVPTPRPDAEAHATAFAGGIDALFDVTYATPPGFAPLTLDIYRPRAHAAPLPMVVYVHGGGWKNGDSRRALSFGDFPRALAGLAAQGYVVASINYRLSPQARFPAALQDVKSAIRWLRGHAASYGGDVASVAVWGASAGGQLAAMAGATCGVMAFEPDSDAPPLKDAPSDCAEAVIDWFGPVEFASPAPYNSKPAADAASEVGNYLGCEPAACARGVVRLASPLTFVSVNSPPFLIQQGAADTEVPPGQSQTLYDALRKKGVPAEIEIYPDVGHGFMRGDTPDTATVTRAMARLTAFLAATFPAMPGPSPKTGRGKPAGRARTTQR